jgi:hypothetical protein
MSRVRLKPKVYVSKINNSFVTKISSNSIEDIPDIVFIRAKARITPQNKLKTYEPIIRELKDDLDLFINNILMNLKSYDNKNYLFSLEMSEKSVQYKKNSHIHYDIFIKPLNNENMSVHHERLKTLVDKINTKLLELFESYSFICL